jgi:hypothetical protein
MAICIITIVHVSLTSLETNSDQFNKVLSDPFFKKGIKLIERTVKTVYRLAMSILITHLK